jgi:hypothetical protein
MTLNMFAAWDTAKPDTENIRGIHLGVDKLKTVQVAKLPLQHKIRTISMNYSASPVLTEHLYKVQKEEFSITRYMRDTCTWRKAKHIRNRQTHLLVREGVTYGL